MKFLLKKILKWKKVNLIFVTGKEKDRVSNLIAKLMGSVVSTKEISKPFKGPALLKLLKGKMFVLADGDYPRKDRDNFFEFFYRRAVVINSENLKKEKNIVSLLSKKDKLFVDYDSLDKLTGKRLKTRMSYGLQADADFFASDLKKDNFKINYSGSSVPVWVNNDLNKEKALEVTSAIGVGVLFGYNLVNLTREIKDISLQ